MTLEAPQTKEPMELATKQYLARLIDSCPDAVISTDGHGNITPEIETFFASCLAK